MMHFRKNWKKYQRRKAIRAEAARRMDACRKAGNNDMRAWCAALNMYCFMHEKIKRYYAVVPMSHWWSFR